MSIIKPTAGQMTRRLVVLSAALFAVVVGQTQVLLGWGQSPAEFAADSDATLKIAPWAFAIWGPIYVGLLVYAVRQALPATGEAHILNRLGWPSALALMAIGWWVVAAAFDAEIVTIILIFGALMVLLVPLLAQSAAIRSLPGRDRNRWLTVWPLAALAGWLTVAAPANLLTVLTGNGDLPDSLPPTGWALAAVAAVVLTGLGVTARLRTLAYPLPIAWGLLGAFAAEQARNPVLAFSALAASVGLLAAAAVLVFRLRRTV